MKLGVCYYPEHWPVEMWEDDAHRMAELGLTHVRIGEFAWSRIEPHPGAYAWDWLDRAVATLSEAGLEIIMGTPTATPPKWLIDQHPGILPRDGFGRVRHFGSRRHYSFSSQAYRHESARIVTAMAKRYGPHPAISMWQTDNEYGCHDTVESNDPDAVAAFRRWLAARYGTIAALNTSWGTVFWSQEYRGFDEIDPPLATVTEANPSHVMDWRRFSSDQVADYNAMQVAIIRQYAPHADITHNFMGHFTAFDHYPVGRQLDISTWDSYPLGFLDQAWWPETVKQAYLRTGHPDFAGFHHDLYRGLSSGRFGVMEQQPGPVNWAGHNPAPQAGMVALWTLEAVAHGAELVSYFRWRQAPFAQEQMHAGLNRRDNVPDQASQEIEAVHAALAPLGSLPDSSKADVALVYDYEAHWSHEIQPQGRSFRHDELSFKFYTALRQLGLDVDIIPADADVSGYKLIVVPSSPMLEDNDFRRLTSAGAHLLVGPRTGSKTRDFQLPERLAPGPLQALLPLRVTRVESLRPRVSEPARMVGEVPHASGQSTFTYSRWREYVETDLDPMVIAGDDSGLAWCNQAVTYVGCWPDDELLDAIVSKTLAKLGIDSCRLPDGMRLRRRGNLLFAFNYGEGGIDETALQKTIDGRQRCAISSVTAARHFAIYGPAVLAD